MKKSVLLLFFALLIISSFKLTGEFWVKHLAAGDRQIRYEPRTAAFLSLHPELTMFDIKGNIFRQGIFKRGNREWIELQNTVSLGDGTFFSLAYSRAENNQIIGYYKIIRFSWFGEVHFVKGIKINPQLFQFGQLLKVGDKIKLLGYEDPGNLIGNVILLNFTKDGELLDFRRLGLNVKAGRYYSAEATLLKTRDDHYIIIKTGDIRVGNDLFKGIHLMKFTENDELVMSKSYYNPDLLAGNFETPVVKEDPQNGYILLLVERINEMETVTRFPHLFKFDEDWQLQWSKKYLAETRLSWLKGVHLLPDGDFYTMGLSKKMANGAEPFSNPVLIRTDRSGVVSWGKWYEYGGPRGMSGILAVNSGGMLMSAHNKYFYMLDSSGDVPGDCPAVKEISFESSDTQFTEKPIESDRIITSFIPGKTTDYTGFFYEYDPSEIGGDETFCHYPVLQGKFYSVIERSRFSGYHIHRLRFSIDPGVAPFIAKVHVYRKLSDEVSDYEFVSEVLMVENQTDYQVEYSPFVLGEGYYRYKITAYNQDDEPVDYAFLQ